MIEPVFNFDQQGRAYCKSHPNYKSYMDSGGDGWILEDAKISFYKCNNCDHYLNDDCFFPQSEIDKITRDSAFKCVFCGEKITKKMNIVYKLKMEHDHQIKIPLTCCDCTTALASKDKMDKFHSVANNKLFMGILEFLLFLIIFYQSLIWFLELGWIMSLISLYILYLALNSIRASWKLRKSIKQSKLLKAFVEE